MVSKFLVSIQGMEDDFSTANNSFERSDLGEWDADKLLESLQLFTAIDYPHDNRFPPKVFITANNQRYTVINDWGQLLLNNSSDQNQVNLKVSPQDIVDILQGKTPTNSPAEEADVIIVENQKEKNAPAILAACGLVFFASIGFSLFQFNQTGDLVHPPVEFRPASDENRASMKQRYVGTYMSGQRLGDVVIVLHANEVFQLYVFTENQDKKKLELLLVDEAPFEFGSRQNQYIAVIKGMETIYLNDGSSVAFHNMVLERITGSYIDYLPEASI